MQDERNKNTLLNHLDRPARFLIFTADEAAAIFIPIFVGFYLGSGLFGCLVSIIAFWGVRTLRKIAGEGAFKQFLYWHVLTGKKSTTVYIPSFVREWGP